MRLLFTSIFGLLLAGCASAPDPSFKPIANLRAISGGGSEIEFRREELWRPHGFNPWPVPRKAEVSTFLSVPGREGDFPATSISMRDDIGTKLLRPWKAYRGQVMLSQEKVVVEISEKGDDGVWRPLEVNGTYQLVEK